MAAFSLPVRGSETSLCPGSAGGAPWIGRAFPLVARRDQRRPRRHLQTALVRKPRPVVLDAAVTGRHGSPTGSELEPYRAARAAAPMPLTTHLPGDTVRPCSLNCFTCHVKARPEFDFICEQDHGCDPIPVSEQIVHHDCFEAQSRSPLRSYKDSSSGGAGKFSNQRL
jgi:hypothetical protein